MAVSKKNHNKYLYPLLVLLSASASSYSYAADLPQINITKDGKPNISGKATITTHGKTMDIHQQDSRALFKWNEFNIAERCTVEIHQPVGGISAHRVIGHELSDIAGTLRAAQGSVVLMNPNGIVFRDGSVIDIHKGHFLATTAVMSEEEEKDFLTVAMEDNEQTFNFIQGAVNELENKDRGSIIVEQGAKINAAAGLAALIGPHVSHKGLITARKTVITSTSHYPEFEFKLIGSGDTDIDFGMPFSDEITYAKDKDGNEIKKKLIDIEGTIKSDLVVIGVNTFKTILDKAVSVTGQIEANKIVVQNGSINLEGPSMERLELSEESKQSLKNLKARLEDLKNAYNREYEKYAPFLKKSKESEDNLVKLIKEINKLGLSVDVNKKHIANNIDSYLKFVKIIEKNINEGKDQVIKKANKNTSLKALFFETLKEKKSIEKTVDYLNKICDKKEVKEAVYDTMRKKNKDKVYPNLKKIVIEREKSLNDNDGVSLRKKIEKKLAKPQEKYAKAKKTVEEFEKAAKSFKKEMSGEKETNSANKENQKPKLKLPFGRPNFLSQIKNSSKNTFKKNPQKTVLGENNSLNINKVSNSTSSINITITPPAPKDKQFPKINDVLVKVRTGKLLDAVEKVILKKHKIKNGDSSITLTFQDEMILKTYKMKKANQGFSSDDLKKKLNKNTVQTSKHKKHEMVDLQENIIFAKRKVENIKTSFKAANTSVKELKTEAEKVKKILHRKKTIKDNIIKEQKTIDFNEMLQRRTALKKSTPNQRPKNYSQNKENKLQNMKSNLKKPGLRVITDNTSPKIKNKVKVIASKTDSSKMQDFKKEDIMLDNLKLPTLNGLDLKLTRTPKNLNFPKSKPNMPEAVPNNNSSFEEGYDRIIENSIFGNIVIPKQEALAPITEKARINLESLSQVLAPEKSLLNDDGIAINDKETSRLNRPVYLDELVNDYKFKQLIFKYD